MYKSLIFIFFMTLKFNLFAMNIEDIKIVTEELPPFLYLDQNGVAQGFLAERVNKIIRKLKIKIKNKIEVQPWARAYDTALKNDGTMLFSLSKTKEREKLFKFCCVILSSKKYLF